MSNITRIKNTKFWMNYTINCDWSWLYKYCYKLTHRHVIDLPIGEVQAY